MKKTLTGLFSLLFISGAMSLNAQDKEKQERFEFVKEKSINKTYPASGNKLEIDNSFGHVKFITWDKNEIKVDIHIEASSNKEDNAQRIFDAISVTDKQDGNSIKFKTTIDNKGHNDCKNCKSNMHINYEVHLPASVALDVENSFGNIDLPDYSGALDVSVKFGNLSTGALGNVKDINIEFGKGDIKSLSNLDAVFKFSKITIGSLSGKNKIKFEFCDVAKIGLDNSISSLTLNESYSTVNLRPIGNLSASYDISTSFGSFVDRTNSGIKRTDTPDKYGPDSDRKYSGQSGSGAAKIDIRSSFGKVILGEPTADDMSEKKKDKQKDKNKNKGDKVEI